MLSLTVTVAMLQYVASGLAVLKLGCSSFTEVLNSEKSSAEVLARDNLLGSHQGAAVVAMQHTFGHHTCHSSSLI